MGGKFKDIPKHGYPGSTNGSQSCSAFDGGVKKRRFAKFRVVLSTLFTISSTLPMGCAVTTARSASEQKINFVEIGKGRPDKTVPFLGGLLKNGNEKRGYAVVGLKGFAAERVDLSAYPGVIEDLCNLLKDEFESVRMDVAITLGLSAKNNPDKVLPFIEKSLSDSNKYVRAYAAIAIRYAIETTFEGGYESAGVPLNNFPGIIEKLGGLLKDDFANQYAFETLKEAAKGVCLANYQKVLEGLELLFYGADQDSAHEAMQILDRTTHVGSANLSEFPRILEKLEKIAVNEGKDRGSAFNVLGHIAERTVEAKKILMKFAKNADPQVRKPAIKALEYAAVRNPDAIVPFFLELLKSGIDNQSVLDSLIKVAKTVDISKYRGVVDELARLSKSKEDSRSSILVLGEAAVRNPKNVMPIIEDLLAGKDREARENAVDAIKKSAEGNPNESEFVSYLGRMLKDRNGQKRKCAAGAFAEIGRKVDISKNEEILEELAKPDKDALYEKESALGGIIAKNPNTMIPFIQNRLVGKDKSSNLAAVALGIATVENPSEIMPHMLAMLKEKKWKAQAFVALKVAASRDLEKLVPYINALLDQGDKEIKWWVAGVALAQSPHTVRRYPVLMERLSILLIDDYWEVRWGACWALEKVAGYAEGLKEQPIIIERLGALLNNDHWEVRWGASGALKKAAYRKAELHPWIIQNLIRRINDDNAGVRSNALGALSAVAWDTDLSSYDSTTGIFKRIMGVIHDKSDSIRQKDGKLVRLDHEVGISARVLLDVMAKKNPSKVEPYLKRARIY